MPTPAHSSRSPTDHRPQTTSLLAWYRAHRRDLPWRRTRDPYRIWVSEIMLQQTRVDTVIPYYERFLRALPDLQALAAAPEQALLKLWEGLGYYRRARHLQAAAKRIVHDLDGCVPATAAGWRELPGIGDYTAAAIASIAQNEPVPVVDGNVLRVAARVWGLTDDIALPRTREQIRTRLQALMDNTPAAHAAPGDFNQALMELGALVCIPGDSPRCAECPLQPDCIACRDDRTAELPVKARRRAVPHYHVAVGIVRRGNSILVQKRPAAKMLGGLWEFPGGKLQSGETPAAALRRELCEEIGLEVIDAEPLGIVAHAYSHFRVTIHAFLVIAPSRFRARPTAADEARWVTPAALPLLPMPAATLRILALLEKNALAR